MNLKIIICGTGGQGVIFLTRLLAQAAIALDRHVMVSETHGMSQRGGSVISHLKIGGNQAPLIQVGTADILFATEADEAVRNLPQLRRGGTVFANAENGLRSEVSSEVERMDFQIECIDAGMIAFELGVPAIANVVLAGFSASFDVSPFSYDLLRETVDRTAKRDHALNLQAFKAGFDFGKKEQVFSG